MCLNSLKKLAKSNAIFKALEKGDLNCFRQIVGKAKKTVELSNLRDRLGRTLLEFIISNHDLVRVSQMYFTVTVGFQLMFAYGTHKQSKSLTSFISVKFMFV